jgi:hypothetical protein
VRAAELAATSSPTLKFKGRKVYCDKSQPFIRRGDYEGRDDMAASRIALWFAASGTLRIVGVYLWGLFIAAAGFPFGAEILFSPSPDPLSRFGDG